ncbi:major histocompatibility complex class I-related gene protein-like isoform X2 [Notolabrus celidotus]|uniref:major histocompatibility complex class I-related gene protein-like isoform X2 n=1 Tax=Notolabrus celidotus TaxID=1203425 RepID=UPI00148F7F8F|nr:major histocompatibility complex class I-related gene protein-like isoform X2 [Notolabrus celidotus]XP_034560208.1 major histocompatibility complex class I-related gene protein-like isoform X2 [Notolabrus celidotus]
MSNWTGLGETHLCEEGTSHIPRRPSEQLAVCSGLTNGNTMMNVIFFLLLLRCHVVTTVTHSLQYLGTASSSIQDFPEFVATVEVDGVQVVYCDSNTKTAKASHDLAKEVMEINPHYLKMYTQDCIALSQIFKAKIHKIKEVFKQTEGVHILQQFKRCEWDDVTRKAVGFYWYGYDGEDFTTLDLQMLRWVCPKHNISVSQLGWETNKATIKHIVNGFTARCSRLLETFVQHAALFLQRIDLPSVSLLQKSPSSPVTCHATGFYPDGAVMFWRKDGEKLFEDVDHGEILPNNDGSFQISEKLNITSVKPEDWRRYECVFRLSVVKDDIVTKLEEAAIRSNKVMRLGFGSRFWVSYRSGHWSHCRTAAPVSQHRWTSNLEEEQTWVPAR